MSFTPEQQKEFKVILDTVTSYPDFWDKLDKYLNHLDIEIEFNNVPSGFVNEYESWNRVEPGWTGNFKGIIKSNNKPKITISNIFGWSDSLIPDTNNLTIGSGSCGSDFRLSGGFIPLKTFPKLYKEWELEGGYLKSEKNQISSEIQNIFSDRISKSNDYALFSKEYKSLEQQKIEVLQILDKIKNAQSIVYDNKVKEFNSKNVFKLPDANTLKISEYFKLKELTFTIDKVSDKELTKKIQDVEKRFNNLVKYVDKHPQYFI